jgi:hypothetical protein
LRRRGRTMDRQAGDWGRTIRAAMNPSTRRRAARAPRLLTDLGRPGRQPGGTGAPDADGSRAQGTRSDGKRSARPPALGPPGRRAQLQGVGSAGGGGPVAADLKAFQARDSPRRRNLCLAGCGAPLRSRCSTVKCRRESENFPWHPTSRVGNSTMAKRGIPERHANRFGIGADPGTP